MGIRRRIFTVTVGTLVLCVALVGMLVYQHHQLQQRLRQQRDRAVRAVEQGRYAEARGILESYLHHTDAEDVEAMISLGRALIAAPIPSRADQVQAMRLFRRAVEREPDHLAARLELLPLQRELGFDEALVHNADLLLALTDDPAKTQRTRRMKAEALLRLERYDEALTVAADAVHAAPENLEVHRLVLKVLADGPWSRREVISYAQEQRAAHPDDVRFDVLLGAAQRLAGRAPEAAATLRRRVDQPMPDSAAARLLMIELEALERFDEALDVLRQSVAAFDDPSLDTVLVARLWQRGRDHAVVRHVASMSADVASFDVELIALHAMSLIRLDRDDEAEPWLEALRRRSAEERSAAAWTVYLTGVFDQQHRPRTVLRRCRRALMHDPENPYIRFAVGEALAAQGERRAALGEWRAAAEACPAWAVPRLHAAETLIELGLGTQAVEMARAAHRRAGDELRPRVVLAEARQLHLAEGGEDSPAALLEWVADIQADHPHESRTLVIYVDLLAEVGRREDAGEILLEALDRPLPERTLLALARVSRTHGLGLADACYAQSEALHGPTPTLALARASDEWNRGRGERALAAIRPQVDQGERRLDEPTMRAWALARARFFDQIDQPDANERWRQLLDRYPDSLTVHRAALEANAVRSDRLLMRRTIDRLRALTDDQAIEWRLAEARWLLGAESVTSKRATEAALLLGAITRSAPTCIEPRLWLARAFVRLDEPGVAIAQLRTATDHAPQHQPVLLELARLLMQQGESAEALAMLNRVVDNRASSVPELQTAAAMLVRLRGWDAAVAALTRAAEAGGRAPGELLMVGLAEQPNDAADAESVESE